MYMKKTIGLVVVLLMAAPAFAGYVAFENFESGATGWTTWLQNGSLNTAKTGLEAENIITPNPLGNIQPESGSNLQNYHIESSSTAIPALNTGIWKQFAVPTGVNLTVDGFWRTHALKRNSTWCEVIIWNKAVNLVNSSDYNPGVDGNFGNGETVYKISTNNSPTTDLFAGSFSNTSLVAPAAYAYNYATGVGGQTWSSSPLQSSTGVVTVLLKYGFSCTPSGTTASKSMDFDDIFITPEPTALILGLLGIPLLVRRRRA